MTIKMFQSICFAHNLHFVNYSASAHTVVAAIILAIACFRIYE